MNSVIPSVSRSNFKINFKYKKKLVVFIMILSGGMGDNGSPPRMCSGDEQEQIINNIARCQIREEVVDLRKYFSNRSDIHQIIPSHAVLRRCSGGCEQPNLTCQPTRTRDVTVDVVLALDVWPVGEHVTVCSQVYLQEDEECACDCRVKEEDCLPDKQIYQPSACSCMCTDYDAQAQCIYAGMFWDASTCSCSCPRETFQPCSTGYVFDLTHTCSCIQISLIASEGLIAAIIIIVAALLLTLVTGFIMYRTRTGLFRAVSNPQSTLRTRLMTQKSRSEFDLIANSKLTLRDFDARKSEVSLAHAHETPKK